MGFWIAAGAFCALVTLALVLAYLRPQKASAPAAAYDLQVYRDQLREVEKDVARGVLTEDEAKRARTEVSRRILEADKALQADAAQTASGGVADRLFIGTALAAMLAGAFAVYAAIGAPGYPDLPLLTRIEIVEEARANRPSQSQAETDVPFREGVPPDPEREAMVAQLRTVMEQRPTDIQGMGLLASNEAALGNFRAARLAQGRLIDLLGDEVTGLHFIDHAEMMVLAAGGYVSPEAETALARGLELEPRNGTARYYAGLMYAQQGRPDLAFPIWRNLLAESTPDAPWVQPIQLQIEEVAFLAGSPVNLDQLVQPRGPTAADIAAAQDMTPEELREFAEGMVNGLLQRLGSEGGSPSDWARAVRSLIELERFEQAEAILNEARGTFADRPDALAIIEDAGAAISEGQAE